MNVSDREFKLAALALLTMTLAVASAHLKYSKVDGWSIEVVGPSTDALATYGTGVSAILGLSKVLPLGKKGDST